MREIWALESPESGKSSKRPSATLCVKRDIRFNSLEPLARELARELAPGLGPVRVRELGPVQALELGLGPP